MFEGGLGASKMMIFKVALLAVATTGAIVGVAYVGTSPKPAEPVKTQVLGIESSKPPTPTPTEYPFEDIVTAPMEAVKEKVKELITDVKNTATTSASTTAQTAATAAFQKLSEKDQEIVKGVICK